MALRKWKTVVVGHAVYKRDTMQDTHVKIDALSKPSATYLTNLGYIYITSPTRYWYHPEFNGYPQYDANFNVLGKHTPVETPVDAPVVSDGGSSSYYELNINGNKVETEEIIDQVFGNDFDFGNAFKSLVRAYASTKGSGKAGNSIQYEMNKIIYSANKIKNRGTK